jgi:hypothetical protein
MYCDMMQAGSSQSWRVSWTHFASALRVGVGGRTAHCGSVPS